MAAQRMRALLASVVETLRGSPGNQDQIELYATDLYGSMCSSAVFPRRVSLRIGEIPQAVRLETEGMEVEEWDASEKDPNCDDTAHEFADFEVLSEPIKHP
jgi:hypothetical protein